MDTLTGQFMKIPKGHVWLQGDNLANSIDSRNYGAVPEATLKGRVLARVAFLFTGVDNRFHFAINRSFPCCQMVLWMFVKRDRLDWERLASGLHLVSIFCNRWISGVYYKRNPFTHFINYIQPDVKLN